MPFLWPALWFVAVVACLYVGQVIGARRTLGPWGGFFLAFFLGPLGLAIAWFWPKLPAAAGARRPA